MTEWDVPLEHPDDNIEQISLDPFGKLWFVERNFDGVGAAGTNKVRRLDADTNVISTYLVPTLPHPGVGVMKRIENQPHAPALEGGGTGRRHNCHLQASTNSGGPISCRSRRPEGVAHPDRTVDDAERERGPETPSAIHEYGDLRVREHFHRFAAEDDRRDTATPV